MPVNASQFDPALVPLFFGGREELGEADWFDAHTHIGQNDPDGRRATPEEILAGLDAAGHRRALVFAMHEPDGYRHANDAVLAAAAASGGRLLPLARVSPHAEDAVAEAERCLRLGARGFKLHPRSDAFGLPPPEVRREIAGGQLARVVAGEDPVDLGPPPGAAAVGERVIESERVVSYAGTALQLAYRGIDPTEPLALARLACQTSRNGEVAQLLGRVEALLGMALDVVARSPETPMACLPYSVGALTLAGTSAAGVA